MRTLDRRDGLALVAIIALAAALFAIRMAAPPNLLDQDQERPAAYVLDAVNNGHWLCQRDLSGDITSKPPLWTWLSALTTLACGRISVFSLYLPGALALAGTALLVFGAARTHFGTRAAVLGALATMLTTAGLKEFGLARTDGVFAFTVTTAALLAFRAWMTGRGWVWVWLAAAAATLAKGPLGPVLAAGGLLACWWERPEPKPIVLRGSHWLGLALFLLLTTGWLLLAYRQLGDPVLSKLLNQELKAHAMTKYEKHWPGTLFWQPPLYYLGRAAPWSVLACYGLYRIWRNRPRNRRVSRQFYQTAPLTPALSPSKGEREKPSAGPAQRMIPPLPLRGGEGRGEGAVGGVGGTAEMPPSRSSPGVGSAEEFAGDVSADAPAAAGAAALAADSRATRLERFAFWWFFLGLFLFSLAPHQRADLLWPIMPAGALIAGRELARLTDGWQPGRFYAWLSALVVLAVAGFAFYYFGPRARTAMVRQTVAVKALAAEIERRAGAEFPLTHLDDPMTLQIYLNTCRPRVSGQRASQLLRGAEAAFLAVSDIRRLEAEREPTDPPIYTLLPDQKTPTPPPIRIVSNRPELRMTDPCAFCFGPVFVRMRGTRLVRATETELRFAASAEPGEVFVTNEADRSRRIRVCTLSKGPLACQERTLGPHEEWLVKLGPR